MVRVLIAQFEEHDRRIFWALVFITGVSLAMYIYFLGVSVVHVIGRKEAESNIEQSVSRISMLESEYVSLDKEIDLSLARSMGFVDVAAPQYISRDSEPPTLSFLGKEAAR